MPPVWNQRAPCSLKIFAQSTSPGRSCDAAVCPRSEQPSAARMPNPLSVKFRPLRTARPTPSYFTQRRCSRFTPPCSMRSSTRRPTALSASAVTIVVSRPKQRRSPRATLYSPPPSHARNRRVVETRMSPGSNRSMTSPRLTRSHRHWTFVLIFMLRTRLRLGRFLQLQSVRDLDPPAARRSLQRGLAPRRPERRMSNRNVEQLQGSVMRLKRLLAAHPYS